MTDGLIAGVVAFVCSSSLAAALACAVHGRLTGAVALGSLLFGGLVARLAARDFAGAGRRERWAWRAFSPGAAGQIEVLAFGLTIAVAVRQFAYLIYRADADYRSLDVNNLGDLPLHLDVIRYVAQGAAWPLRNPIFALEPLRYPLGSDLHAALWEALGVPTASHLFWVGVALTVASLLLLRSWASWWGIAAVYFSGGWTGWTAGAGLDWQSQVAWKNVFLAALLTQRGLLFAIPIGVMLLVRYRRTILLPDEPLRMREALWLGFFWGALAFFHPHSFLAVSLMIGGYAVIGAGRSRSLLPSLAVAVPLGGFWILHASAWLRRASIIHVSWGWTRGLTPWGRYVGDNFGPWSLLAVFSLAAVWWGPAAGRSRRLLWEGGLYLALFLLFFNVMLAPWEWDNIKVLIWPFIGFGLFFNQTLSPAIRSSVPSGIAVGASAAALAFVASASGVRALLEASSDNSHSVRLFSVGELALTKGALVRVPIDAVLLTKPSYDHPACFLGRARAVGYAGHLWSHGIDGGLAAKQAEEIFQGVPDWRRLVRNLKITHIFWGPIEKAAYGDAPKPWQKTLANVSGVPEYDVYEIKDEAAGPPEPADAP